MTQGKGFLQGLVVAAAALGGAVQAAEAPRYRVHNLGTLAPRSNSTAAAINESGLVAGTMNNGVDGTRQAFLGTSRSDLRLLGTLGGSLSVALGLNDRGEVAGWSLNAEGVRRPALYSGGRWLDLADPADGFTRGVANAVNAAGQATGQFGAQAFIHDGTRSRELRIGNTSEGLDINDHGVVVGGAVMAGDVVRRPFLYESGRTTLLPSLGGTFGQAWAINNAGQVVGYSYTAGGELLPFVYGGGVMTALAPAGFGEALDINDQGWIVGSLNLSAALWHGDARWKLDDLVARDQADRWQLLSAQSINERGQIAGYGLFHGRLRGFVATPVPEAQTWAMLLAGLGVVGVVARRRARMQRAVCC